MKCLCRGLIAVAICFVGLGQPAAAGPLDDLLVPWSISSPYFAVGVSTVHHTGYFANGANAMKWVPGAKAYIGTQFTPAFSGEITYFHFGESPIRFSSLHEKSDAATISLLAHYRFSKHSAWHAAIFGRQIASILDRASLFAKGGAAYKWIRQESPGAGVISENGATFHIGFGMELNLPNGFFLRGEYDYVGKIDTDTVINVQHTPISVSIGKRL